MSVLCFGSLNIDYVYKVEHFVKKGETISSDSMSVFPGGKGLNQAIALSKAGAEVYQAGAVGEDGRFLLELLKESKVNTDYVRILEEISTGKAIIQNDRLGDNCIILYRGANHAITKEQIDQVLGHFGEKDYLVLQNEINNLEYLIDKAHTAGIKIVLNPSPMNQTLKKIKLEQVDFLILNEVEAAQLMEMEAVNVENMKMLAHSVRQQLPHIKVVVTLGGDGAVYFDREHYIEQKAYQVTAVDTTAAGDTFTGYFLSSLFRGMPKQKALEMAAKAAAIAVSRPGAAPSIPEWREVEALETKESF